MTRTVYTFLLYLLLPFTPIKLLWRGRKQPEYLQYWRERYGFYSVLISKPVIWLHCVSVGETRAAAPLVKALLQQYPNHQILLTHTTPTGRATSEQLFGDSINRVYLPYDVPFAVNSFLKHFKPAIGVLMETELWFNLIARCKQQNIPLLLVNARLSEKSAIGYTKLGRLVSEGLQNLSAIAAQTQEDAARLQMLGARDVMVTGNLKFDVKPPEDSLEKGLQLRTLLNTKRVVFLAASTREGEEALILEAVKDLDILTIIVPRHPQRFDEVAALIEKHVEKHGLNYMRRSDLESQLGHRAKQEHEGKEEAPQTVQNVRLGADDATDKVIVKQDVSIVLGDSMGELFTYYAACDFTFVGGSLLKFGGQNLIEATSMGKPVLIGPHTFNFADATKNAITVGAAILVNNVAELREKIQFLQHNAAKQEKMRDAALNYCQSATGATKRMLAIIAIHLRCN